MRVILQRLVRLERVLRQQGRRAALKSIGCYLSKRLDLATVAQVNAIGSELAAQQSTLDAQRCELDAQSSALNAQHLAFDAQHLAFDAQQLELNAQRSALDAQRSALDAQHSEFKARQSEIDAQRLEFNAQRSALDAQRCELNRLASEGRRLDDENRLLREQLGSSRKLIEALYVWKHENSLSIRWLADHHRGTGLPVRTNCLGNHAVGAAARVSVIMPTWNRAATICNAIQSVLDQTYADWELLIISDGSEDDTRAVVSRYLADRRIRYLEQSHAGASAARNHGLLHASGEIIAYLDSDNVWYCGYLESVVGAFTDSPQEKSSYAALLIVNQSEGNVRILACPYNRQQLEQNNQIDMNVFAHRRELYDRLGGFDESLTRLGDWDLILRYTKDAPPVALPILGTRYYAGRPDSITARESLYDNWATIRRKLQPRVNAPLKVLYVLWHYPQLSESYVETEIRYMQRRGVDVEVWSEVAATSAPYPTNVPIHHGSLAQAIEQVRPHVVHVHWMNQALNYADTVRAAGLSLTVRGHGFEVTPEAIASLEQHPATAAIYLFPHFAGENLHLRPKIRPMTSCFNPELYAPDAEKDARLVVRAGCGLSTKDLQTFIHLAQLFPDHHFVLALVRAQGQEGYVDEIVALNQSLGSPVDIRVNVSFPQIAALVQKAGIYLHTHGLEAPYGMPISIAEAMATGCYVLARRCVAAEAYLGPAGRLYDGLDEAAALVRETLTWSHERWQQVRRTAIEHAFRNYVDSEVLPPLVDEWVRIAGEAVHCDHSEHLAAWIDILQFPRQSQAQATEDSGPSAFRLVA